MGGMCSACTDVSQAERASKQRQPQDQQLLPKKKESSSEIEGRPSSAEELSERDASLLRKPTTDLETFDNLFEDLAKFMKQLPAKSKKHIWEHAVVAKDKDGVKRVFDKTTSQDQIAKVLCDCVIVYVKYLNRKEKPLKTQAVLPYVEPVAQWILKNHGNLEKRKFEEEVTYLADMLDEYQHFVK